MRRLIAALLILAPHAFAGWDQSKPSESSPTRQSSEIRANWAALAATVGAQNLVADGTFLLWAAGPTSSPTMYEFTAAGGSIARTGVGESDTTRKYGTFAAKITTAASSSTLDQDMVSSTYDGLALEGSGYFSCGAWVKASVADVASIFVIGNASTQSSFHTGGGTWQWLTATTTLTGSATDLLFRFQVEPPTRTAYVSGVTCVFGQVPPSAPQPSAWQNFEFDCITQGNSATGTDKLWCHKQSPFYGLVQDVSFYADTAPAGAAWIADVNTWDGAAYTSMYSSGGRPRLADGAKRSDAAPPDSTYARRCIVPQHGTTQAVGGEISFDIDQIGSGTPGRDIRISIRGIRVARPLQAFLDAAE